MQFTVIKHDPMAGRDSAIAQFVTRKDAESFIDMKYRNRYGLSVLSGITYSVTPPAVAEIADVADVSDDLDDLDEIAAESEAADIFAASGR